MKRLTSLFLVLVFMFSLAACSSNENYDEKLFELSEDYNKACVQDIMSMEKQGVDITIDVNKLSDNAIEVYFNGETTRIEFEANDEDNTEIEIKNPEELTKKEEKYVLKAKEAVIGYINSSEILTEKETLIQKIEAIKVMAMDMPTIGLYKNDCVYINKDELANYSMECFEFAVTHELIHALAALTNGGVENECYGTKKLNEVITDIIAVQIFDKKVNFVSAYSDFYYHGYSYISFFKEKAIKAYFYGYEEIWEIADKTEFDFFVEAFSNAPYDMYAHMYTVALLHKWVTN